MCIKSSFGIDTHVYSRDGTQEYKIVDRPVK